MTRFHDLGTLSTSATGLTGHLGLLTTACVVQESNGDSQPASLVGTFIPVALSVMESNVLDAAKTATLQGLLVSAGSPVFTACCDVDKCLD